MLYAVLDRRIQSTEELDLLLKFVDERDVAEEEARAPDGVNLLIAQRGANRLIVPNSVQEVLQRSRRLRMRFSGRRDDLERLRTRSEKIVFVYRLPKPQAMGIDDVDVQDLEGYAEMSTRFSAIELVEPLRLQIAVEEKLRVPLQQRHLVITGEPRSGLALPDGAVEFVPRSIELIGPDVAVRRLEREGPLFERIDLSSLDLKPDLSAVVGLLPDLGKDGEDVRLVGAEGLTVRLQLARIFEDVPEEFGGVFTRRVVVDQDHERFSDEQRQLFHGRELRFEEAGDEKVELEVPLQLRAPQLTIARLRNGSVRADDPDLEFEQARAHVVVLLRAHAQVLQLNSLVELEIVKTGGFPTGEVDVAFVDPRRKYTVVLKERKPEAEAPREGTQSDSR